ncbi:SOS-induced cell division inhibitor SulA [Pseudomonas japonica]|uniref:SOS-induced cell division inhibitor SulA n=1 Tax=Pseudomonas japonica TaxID=256466 RepID=UPI0015E4081F|nr:SOS-induced cell division inhibitor SulA [Pseudomonas japonica]MBA1242643.1 CDP-glycerol--UDP-pyrophosphoryl-N-acetylglucosaminyl-N-acetylmannosamine glycerophosphotransferase [Pseudomonas japonica]MBA1289126.1 CDP-glycerol--UDP-pyrophosphoryl-N-acetylglucosaminyl-N-acetylmannosamine glycerophosphotransferase [Pseudomonas japonica]
MQFSTIVPNNAQHTQLSLFEAFIAPPGQAFQKAPVEGWPSQAPEVFSELSLRGATGNCLSLLAPMLRELSEGEHMRWLTLVAPPASLTQNWLRDAGLNRERILLLQPRANQTPLQLACEALRLGKSHTVVSWVNPLNTNGRQQLVTAARQGDAQSLNIRLG